MDPKTLLKRTSEHYEIHQFRLDADEQARIDALGTPLASDKYRLEKKPKPCEDCGLEVKGRRVTYIQRRHLARDMFWEKKCWGCGEKTTANSLGKILKK